MMRLTALRDLLTAISFVTMVSLSGNAFSVYSGRGRFISPRGQLASEHKLRRYPMILSICSSDNCSLNEGMISEKPRKDPPLVMIARQVESGSGEVLGQSEKSGKLEGGTNPRIVCGCPLPSAPWQPTQPASNNSLPLAV